MRSPRPEDRPSSAPRAAIDSQHPCSVDASRHAQPDLAHPLRLRDAELMDGTGPVFRTRDSLHESARGCRCWQGAPTRNTQQYAEEAQRRQRRRDPLSHVTNLWFGTLARRG